MSGDETKNLTSRAVSSHPSAHPMAGQAPWIAGNLRIRGAVMEAIAAHAKREYPSECCGFLFGPEEVPALLDAHTEEVNEADKYHALDPVAFPRTARTYFKINELRASRQFDEATAAKRPLKVIYHSHCDAGAYFSAEDAATFAQAGQLMWPCAFVVVSVMSGEIADTKLWIHRAGSGEFDESRLEVEP